MAPQRRKSNENKLERSSSESLEVRAWNLLSKNRENKQKGFSHESGARGGAVG